MVDCVFEDRDALLPRLAVDGTNPFFPEYVLSFVDCGIVVGDVQPKRVGSIQALVIHSLLQSRYENLFHRCISNVGVRADL